MTIWSNGDVSGSQTLTDDDHLYPAHINELRTAFSNIRFRGEYNVKDYGAMGDGVTDDTVAVKAAIADIPSTGGTLFFPSGTYVLSDRLSLSYDNIYVLGSGPSTILFWKAGSNEVIFYSDGNDYLRFSGFTIDGNRANVTLSRGIHILNSNYIWIDSVYIKNCTSHPILIQNTTATVSNVFVTNCLIYNAAIGITVSDCYHVVISNNNIDLTNESCIQLYTIENFAVTGNICRHALGSYAGIRSSGGGVGLINGTISGNTIEDCGRGIFLLSGSKDITVTGNVIRRSLAQGMLLQAVDGSTISGNTVLNSGQTAVDPGDKAGIYLATVTNSSITGNVSIDDQGAGATQSRGIYEDGGTNLIIMGNNLKLGNTAGSLFTNGTNVIYETAANDQYNII